MTFKPNPNYYKELKSNVADELVSLITDENASWRKTWRADPNDRYIPINAVSKEEYKGMNVWLLWGQSKSNVWCTMLGWKKLGYSQSLRMVKLKLMLKEKRSITLLGHLNITMSLKQRRYTL